MTGLLVDSLTQRNQSAPFLHCAQDRVCRDLKVLASKKHNTRTRTSPAQAQQWYSSAFMILRGKRSIARCISHKRMGNPDECTRRSVWKRQSANGEYSGHAD